MSFNITKVGIIGTGTMGTGIAAQVLAAGIPVCFLDVVPSKLNEAEVKNGFTKESYEFRNRISIQAVKRMENTQNGIMYDVDLCSMITVGNLEDDLKMLKDCDWIIEVVVEKLRIKKTLLNKILPYIKENAIISSNTSGVSITDIAEELPINVRRRFLGTHFFNPPRFMKLLELIPGKDTSAEVYKYMRDFGRHRLGKEIVNAKDTPNFIANRVGVYSSVIALNLMKKYGYTIEKVDQLTGKEMMRPKSAVFKTIDMVGLDVLYNISNNLAIELSDEKEIAAFALPEFYNEMVKLDLLGDKSGAGFYKTVKTPKGREKMVWNPDKKEYQAITMEKVDIIELAKSKKTKAEKLQALISGNCEESRFAWEVVKGTLIYSASKIPEIADDYKEIDKALRYGYNWEIGPFEIWDEIGVCKSVERMIKEGEKVPNWVINRLNEGKEKFYNPVEIKEQNIFVMLKENANSAILDLGEGVVAFDIRTSGNAINNGMIEELQEAVFNMENDSDIKGMIITNKSENFCNGADLVTIFNKIEETDFKGIADGIDGFHATSMMLKYAKKPIVAAVHGMVLGGGLEFMMHCHRTVAYAESYMGLVEAGVGLVPGGGGMKELLMRYMEKVKSFEFSDYNPVVQKAWEIVATAKVSKNAFDAKKMGFLREIDRIVLDYWEVNETAKNEVLRMCEDGFKQTIPKEIQLTGISGRAYLEYIITMMKAGNMISAYDAVIAKAVAEVLTGGELPKKAVIHEVQMLELEKEAFLKLVANKETKDRIRHMITKGKPLRN